MRIVRKYPLTKKSAQSSYWFSNKAKETEELFPCDVMQPASAHYRSRDIPRDIPRDKQTPEKQTPATVSTTLEEGGFVTDSCDENKLNKNNKFYSRRTDSLVNQLNMEEDSLTTLLRGLSTSNEEINDDYDNILDQINNYSEPAICFEQESDFLDELLNSN